MEICPRCGSGQIKKNGHIHNQKQNFYCKECGRNFVENPEQKLVSARDKELSIRMIEEKISFRAVSRIIGVSLPWVLKLAKEVHDTRVPTEVPDESYQIELQVIRGEEEGQWIWVAIERKTDEVISYHIDSLTPEGAQRFWNSIPIKHRKSALFKSHLGEAFDNIVPDAQRINSRPRPTRKVS
ncbi:IS1 family transposase [Arundinibacter roseus]|uniref:IS1 family transposase n=1 Tax=Arundinibacter roseus TaxID=2070510 RepID=A0A4R4K7N6_9BACT|nr:IS1 family transposase [Arundinibacter roseus]TDB63624.1 IS1 family transposase [Arundinibacter roseus]